MKNRANYSKKEIARTTALSLREIAFAVGSLTVFPASFLLIWYQLDKPKWCFADTCIDANRTMQAIMRSNIIIYYAFLAFTFITAVSAHRIAAIKRILSIRVFSCSTITVAELGWIALAFTALGGAEFYNYQQWWNRRQEKWFKAKKPEDGLVFQSLYNSSGDTLAILIGLVILPVSKNSFLATCLNLPYTSLMRVHTWLARSLFWGTVFHAGSGLVMHVIAKDNIIKTYFTVQAGSPWGTSRYQTVMGLTAFTILLIVVCTSLSYVRRKWYNVFYFTHVLVFVFILFAYFHASNCVFFLLPGLILYSIDGIVRLSTRFSSDVVSSVQFEECGYVTFTVATKKAAFAKPGQFMRVCIPSVAKFELHPLSIVKATDSSVTFLFAPSTQERQWTTLLATHLQTYQTGGHSTFHNVKAQLQGPFGKSMELLESRVQDAIVFYVGGTGVAASIQAIEQVLSLNRANKESKQIKVFLFWSSHFTNLAQLSHLKSWILDNATQQQDIVVELFETFSGSQPVQDMSEIQTPRTSDDTMAAENVFLNLRRAELDCLLEKHVSPLRTEESADVFELGIFICGPGSFTKDALKAVEQYSKQEKGIRTHVEIESFDL
ncbi:UNVERIFIED_CONTAM: hypothetical protein HDU68_009498 [Siphonaria sp. JEL0065]|nr:hypothetical protein HDU68_009498 [Siphonaria sp. JEL0065]